VLRALRKRKPQETQALASSQSWLPLLRPSISIGWRLRLLRENFTQQTQRFSFMQRVQRERLRLNGNRALVGSFARRFAVIIHADESRGSTAFICVCVCVCVSVSPGYPFNIMSKVQRSRSTVKAQKRISAEGDQVAGVSLRSVECECPPFRLVLFLFCFYYHYSEYC